ncbi:MAG: cupin fold metalloprotein, WbuC family [Planctomycetes bacterium]|nr:cupin fold metalloprotein, WbuC family [Planctomycetota bacterium]
MERSSIVLADPECVWIDDGPWSRGYFCKRAPVRIDGALVAELKAEAARLGDRNVRLCLHDSPDAAFHEMVIVERRGKYYRPHKHLRKGESYHVIEGEMGAFVFDEYGRILDASRLSAEGNFLYRVGANMYHAVMPLTDLVVYHEAKPGPFLREGDSVYPPWAPDGSDSEAAIRYTAELLRALGNR